MLFHCKPYGVCAPLENLASIMISEWDRFIDKVLLKFQAKEVNVHNLPKSTTNINLINLCSRT